MATTKTAKTSGGSALVAQLEALGVEVVFGIPGVHNLAIFEALDRSSIRTIVVRHEQTAGYAADGYARATGRLGVCVTTTGPGAANAAAAMGEARMSRSPVLHISTQLDTRSLEGRTGRFQLHEAPDQLEMMRAVCRWAGRVQREDAIGQMVVRAAREAFAGRRGPVFLEIPFDLLATETTRKPEMNPKLVERVTPDPDQLARALDRLERGMDPVIWSGGGVVSSDASEELTRLAELLDAPVVTTFAGKGSIPASHPLAVPFPPHLPDVTKLLEEAGVLVIVGSDLDGMNTQGWRLPLARPRVAINVVGEDARRNYGCESIVEADARLALEAMLKELPVPKPRRGASPGAKRAAAVRKAAVAKLRKSKEFAEPYRFVERLRAAVPEDAFVIADMAVGGYWTAGFLPATQPRTFAYPLGWGTLGFALPASIGAAAAGRRAVVVCGDGGLAFAPGELATAVQEKLPITVLCVDDGGYGMLRFDARERFGREFAADLVTPDFVRLAAAFGAKAKRVTLAGLEDGLAWSLKQKGPSLLALDARFAPPPTTSPRWPLKGKPEARP